MRQIITSGLSAVTEISVLRTLKAPTEIEAKFIANFDQLPVTWTLRRRNHVSYRDEKCLNILIGE
jgi:hypothetical protein